MTRLRGHKVRVSATVLRKDNPHWRFGAFPRKEEFETFVPTFKNKLLYYDHKYDKPPVGRITNGYVNEKGDAVIDAEIDVDDTNEFAVEAILSGRTPFVSFASKNIKTEETPFGGKPVIVGFDAGEVSFCGAPGENNATVDTIEIRGPSGEQVFQHRFSASDVRYKPPYQDPYTPIPPPFAQPPPVLVMQASADPSMMFGGAPPPPPMPYMMPYMMPPPMPMPQMPPPPMPYMMPMPMSAPMAAQTQAPAQAPVAQTPAPQVMFQAQAPMTFSTPSQPSQQPAATADPHAAEADPAAASTDDRPSTKRMKTAANISTDELRERVNSAVERGSASARTTISRNTKYIPAAYALHSNPTAFDHDPEMKKHASETLRDLALVAHGETEAMPENIRAVPINVAERELYAGMREELMNPPTKIIGNKDSMSGSATQMDSMSLPKERYPKLALVAHALDVPGAKKTGSGGTTSSSARLTLPWMVPTDRRELEWEFRDAVKENFVDPDIRKYLPGVYKPTGLDLQSGMNLNTFTALTAAAENPRYRFEESPDVQSKVMQYKVNWMADNDQLSTRDHPAFGLTHLSTMAYGFGTTGAALLNTLRTPNPADSNPNIQLTDSMKKVMALRAQQDLTRHGNGEIRVMQ